MKDIFPSLIGNEQLRRALSGNLSHAYIIEGPKGSGKLTAARNAAAAQLCENCDSDAHTLPCGECNVCSRIFRGIHPDVMEFSAESKKSIGVETARQIRSQVFISPVESACKFFVISDADLMTPEAQNALLISIEEPPAFSVFFLLVTDRTLLLETIRSRCVSLTTEKLPDDVVTEQLLLTPEGARIRNADPQGFDNILKIADGSLGEAKRLLTDRSDDLAQTRQMASELVRMIFSGSSREKIEFATSLPKTKDIHEKIYSAASLVIRDIIAKKMHTDAEPLFFGELSEAPFTSVPLKRLIAVWKSLDDAVGALKGNISPSLTAERIIMQTLS